MSPLRSSVPFEAAHKLAQEMSRNPVIRTINFHNTPAARLPEYRSQISELAQRFSPVSEDDLEAYLIDGEWKKAKPGLIIALYEGYRNSFDVLLPLLEEFGFIGWLFVITDFVNAPRETQLQFAKEHDIGMETREYPDTRYALSWDELRQIDKRHVVASHARSHIWLADLEDAKIEAEVMGSQSDFVRNLGHPVSAFVSYGGPAYGEHPKVDKWIARAQYRTVFSNFRIQKIQPTR